MYWTENNIVAFDSMKVGLYKLGITFSRQDWENLTDSSLRGVNACLDKAAFTNAIEHHLGFFVTIYLVFARAASS